MPGRVHADVVTIVAGIPTAGSAYVGDNEEPVTGVHFVTERDH
jgi:hypothetical protein